MRGGESGLKLAGRRVASVIVRPPVRPPRHPLPGTRLSDVQSQRPSVASYVPEAELGHGRWLRRRGGLPALALGAQSPSPPSATRSSPRTATPTSSTWTEKFRVSNPSSVGLRLRAPHVGQPRRADHGRPARPQRLPAAGGRGSDRARRGRDVPPRLLRRQGRPPRVVQRLHEVLHTGSCTTTRASRPTAGRAATLPELAPTDPETGLDGPRGLGDETFIIPGNAAPASASTSSS